MKSSLNDGAVRIYTRVDDDWVMLLDDGTTWRMSDNLTREQVNLAPDIALAEEGDQLIYRRRSKPIWIRNSQQAPQSSVYCLLENDKISRVAGDSSQHARSRIKTMLQDGLKCPPFSLFLSEGTGHDMMLYEPGKAPVALTTDDQP